MPYTLAYHTTFLEPVKVSIPIGERYKVDENFIPVGEMVALTETAEKEMSAEILLSARGFADAVVSITGNTVDVVVAEMELTDSQRAQIEDIVMRKTGASIENIVISTASAL